MGLKPVEFYAISPADFELMVQGFRNSRIDSYKQTRSLMFTMAKVMGSNISSPEELWPLDGKEIAEDDEDHIKKLFEAEKAKWQKD